MKKKKDNELLALKVVRWIYPKVERIFPALTNRFFIRLFFTPLHYTPPEKEKTAQAWAEKFTVRAAGKKIQCYRWGKSERHVLMVHGWAGRGTQFRRFIKPLMKAGYAVVAFDGPAHGQSEGRRTSILEFEETLRVLYENTGTPEAVIAHSFGGSAVLYAATQGLVVKKLVMIASPTIGDEIINAFLRAVHASDKAKVFLKQYWVKTTGKPFEEFTGLYFVKHLPAPVPLLVVQDADDKDVRPIHAEELIKAYPAARLLRTQGLGHTRILKDDAVIDQCVTFIAADSSVQ